ncbi:MAG: DMT family transporter [Chloroflexi bacterium]|nr:MAG: DMT family transporter [Chloroflexota bacterium]
MAEPIQSPSERDAAASWRPYIVMGIGVLAVSTGAIFIRLAQEESAPSLVIAAARLWVAALVLTPLVLRRYWHEVRAVSLTDLKWALAAGAFLGLHFATWVTSLEYTAVVNSVTLVSTNPLWVAVLAPILLGEKLSRWTMLGLALALVGGVLVGLSPSNEKPPTRSDPLLGNGLALVGALTVALYFIIGRRLRARLSVVVYIWLVYGAAAIILAGAVLIFGEQVTGLSTEAYLWMILIGLVPQLIGHSSFNYALGFLPAAYVSLVVLGEPIGSGLLAMIFLDEWPVLIQLVGATLILVGIGVASKEDRVRKVERVSTTEI